MIEVNNLAKYYGDTVALRPVSFELKKGETLSVVGLSGCGKSTLLKCLAGLIPGYDGSISIAGETHDAYLRNHRVAMVFQRYSNFEWLTVFENLTEAFAARGLTSESLQKCDEMLGLLGLSVWRNAYISELSGGMAQRVALGRALLQEQDVIGLDEPFAALDIKNRRAMQQLVRTMFHKEQRTAVFVTHDIAEAVSVGDRVFILSGDSRTEHAIIDCSVKSDLENGPFDDSVAIERVREISEYITAK